MLSPEFPQVNFFVNGEASSVVCPFGADMAGVPVEVQGDVALSVSAPGDTPAISLTRLIVRTGKVRYLLDITFSGTRIAHLLDYLSPRWRAILIVGNVNSP